MTASTLTDRDLEVLRDLRGVRRHEYVRPMDIGARDGSHHSATLAKLCRRGLAERRRRGTLANYLDSHRGSWEYRITDAGRRVKVPAW